MVEEIKKVNQQKKSPTFIRLVEKNRKTMTHALSSKRYNKKKLTSMIV